MSNYYNRQWRLPNNENKAKQSNYSMDFDGSSQQINSTSNLGISGASPRTFSAWMKTTDAGGGFDVIVATGNSGNTGNNFELDLRNNVIMWERWGLGIMGSVVVNDGSWHHACITYDGNILKLYVDGSEDTGGDFPYTIGATTSTDTPVRIGGMNHSQKYFNGQIDGISIFNYALSASQVTTLYGSSSTGIGNPMSLSPKPVAYYQIGDKSAFNGADYLVPNIAAEEDDGDIATSYSPFALNFDGTNDYIDCGNNSSLNITGALTVSAWIKPNTSVNGGASIVNKRSGYPNINYELIPFGAGVRFYIGSENAASSFSLQANMWTHLVGVFRPAQSIDLYWNGSLNRTTSTSTTTAPTVTNSVIIGSNYNQSVFFNGSISNVSIWNAALTSSQVSEIYNEGVPSNLNNHSAYSNLVSWWQLGSNTSWVDPYWIALDEKGTNNGESQNVAAPNNMGENAIVDGVGSYANGLSNSMGGDEVIGDAPYSSSNSLSVNMDVEDRVSDTPS